MNEAAKQFWTWFRSEADSFAAQLRAHCAQGQRVPAGWQAQHMRELESVLQRLRHV